MWGVIRELVIARVLGRNVRLVEVDETGLAILRGHHPFKCSCPICSEHNFAAADGQREALAHVRGAINRALDEVERNFADEDL